MPNKEQIYDEQIHPLMAQVVAICQQHGIAFVANFAVPNDEDESVQALTHLPDETGSFPASHIAAVRCIRPPQRSPLMLTTVRPDGGTTITAVL